MASIAQLSANRTNARRSTGPRTPDGKRRASLNALRHGVLSDRIVLAHEDPSEYRAHVRDLVADLGPVGALETAIVERIAVTLWRQRRLLRAEAAMLDLEQLEHRVATEATRVYNGSRRVRPQDLEPFDQEQAEWCRDVVKEYERIADRELTLPLQEAPLIQAQLERDVEGKETVEQLVAKHDGGLASYIAELANWCRKELRRAERRPEVLAVAERVRAKAAVLPSPALDVLTRYQSAIDNQLAKAMRALKDAQALRTKLIDASPLAQEIDGAAA